MRGEKDERGPRPGLVLLPGLPATGAATSVTSKTSFVKPSVGLNDLFNLIYCTRFQVELSLTLHNP